MPWLMGWLTAIVRAFLRQGGPAQLTIENLALRQQLAVLQRGKKPDLMNRDRAFWVLLHRLWPGCLRGWLDVKDMHRCRGHSPE